jgi:hypothetical protein
LKDEQLGRNTMWMQALMLTPYVAIASSVVLAVTVVLVCYSQHASHGTRIEA